MTTAAPTDDAVDLIDGEVATDSDLAVAPSAVDEELAVFLG